MIIRILSILFLSACSACGILGLYKDNVNRDPAYQAKAIAELNNGPVAREMDSLIKQIDLAPLMIPEDLERSTLIVETYEYNDFLKAWTSKYHTQEDNKQNRRAYKKYNRTKSSLIKNPKYRVIYADKSKFDTFDMDDYRYVLKTSNRIHYDPDHLTVTNDGFVYSFVCTGLYYIYDRKTGNVYREISDFSVLSKK